MENSYQKFTKDIILIGIARFLILFLGVVRLPLLTKTLGAHDYGIWSQIGVTLMFCLAFVDLNLTGAMLRFLAAEKNKRAIQDDFCSVVSIVFSCGLIVSLVMIVFAYPIAMNFFDGAVQIIRITALLMLLRLLSFAYLSLLQAFQQMKRYSIVIIARECGQVGLIAYLALNGYGILSIVSSALAIEVVTLVSLFFLIKSQISIKKPHFFRMKEYLSYSLPALPAKLAFWVVQSSDRYVIGYFLGVTSVGIYSAAYILGNLLFVVTSVLTVVLTPALSKLYDEGRMNEVKTTLRYSFKYSLAIAIPFIFGSVVLAEPVLRVLSTPEIAGRGSTIVPLIALGISFYGIYAIPLQHLLLVKKTKIVATIWVIAAIVNLGLNILVVPYWGILGAATTTLIAFALALGITTYYALKEFKFSVDWLFITKSLIASGIMSIVVWLIAPTGSIDTVLSIVAGMAVYGVAIFLLKGFTKKEISFFWGLLRRGALAAKPGDNKAKE